MKAKSWKSFVPKTSSEETSSDAMDSLRTLFQSSDGAPTGDDKAELEALLGEDSQLLSLMAERERLEQNMQSASGGAVSHESDPRYSLGEVPSMSTIREREKELEEKRQKSVEHFIEKKKEQQAWLSNKENASEKRNERASDEPSFTSDKKFYEFDGLNRPLKHKSRGDDLDVPRLKTRSVIEKERDSKKDDWGSQRDFYSAEHKGEKKNVQRLKHKHKDKVEQPLTFESDKKFESKTSIDFRDSEKSEPKKGRTTRKTTEDTPLAFASDRQVKDEPKARSSSQNKDPINRSSSTAKSVDELRDQQRAQRNKSNRESKSERPEPKDKSDDFTRLDEMRKRALERRRNSEEKSARQKKKSSTPTDMPFDRIKTTKDTRDQERLTQRDEQRFSKRYDLSREERRAKSKQNDNKTSSKRLDAIKQEEARQEKRDRQKEERRLNKKDKYS
jgi:hypothetical protein